MRTDCPAWAPPLLALQFLTRMPVPGLGGLSGEAVRIGLGRAVGWFPLAGALIGGVTASVLVVADAFWPRLVAVLLALLAEAWLTGAFHEDAVADFCDAFGGGRDAEAIRRIMKDSRIGSHGALGLMLGVGLRAALLVALPSVLLVPALLGSATFGRLLVVAAMAAVAPAPAREGLAKDVAAAVGARQLALALLAALPGLLPLLLLAPGRLLLACGGGTLFLAWFRSLLRRSIGGSTGDCLGFSAYVGQLILLLAIAAR
ncbi:adenosylcobinamide-GDP ribazoletransferase [Sphingomonas oleivorans]|uniref:adenosylcobinamide-GDP ribazoletransferase n=1 Tax=Sphingomonas oleivorans TaxID=1735121 RepID=UPI001FAEFA06|nr:adenosylcobinamide-GDP ribazoletransferase [Sphingomonas oleivorans]